MSYTGPYQQYTIDEDDPVKRVEDWALSAAAKNTGLAQARNEAVTDAQTYTNTKDTTNRADWAAADTAKLNEAKAYTDTEVTADRVRLTTAETKNTEQDSRLDALPTTYVPLSRGILANGTDLNTLTGEAHVGDYSLLTNSTYPNAPARTSTAVLEVRRGSGNAFSVVHRITYGAVALWREATDTTAGTWSAWEQVESLTGSTAKLAEGKTYSEALIGPKVISLDTDGTPYWNPTTGTHRVFLDTDGTPYYSVLPWPQTEVDTDGTPALLDPPTQTWTRAEADAKFATQTALDGKAATVHVHAMADVTGLEAALAATTPAAHTHVTGDVTGLDTALSGKAATTHTHVIADITNDVPWSKLSGTVAGAAVDFAGTFDEFGAAAAAEAAANSYSGTLAYGTNLEATDATVAAFADDPGTATGARFAGKVAKGDLVLNVLDYGADKTGATATHTHIQAAITAATNAGGGVVFLPKGTYSIGAYVSLRSNVSLVGAGQGLTVLNALSSITTGILVGTTGNAVTNMRVEHMTLDGGYSTHGLQVVGLQVTAGSNITARYATVRNCGGSGIIYSATVDSTVERCTVDTVGMLGTGHNISLSNASHRAKILYNRVTGGLGMGIYIGTLGNGSVDCHIIGNDMDNEFRDPGLENIGVTAECVRTIIMFNQTRGSHDNGISITADDSQVIGNIIDGAYRSGVAVGGSNTTVMGNRIRNAGMNFPNDGGLAWGGVSLLGHNNVVMGNVIYDDQATPTMSYGVKEINPSTGNVIIGNRCRGFRLSEILRYGDTSLALIGTRQVITGSRGGNAALGSLLSALSTAGIIKDTTTA